jgi:hypothetical protein
METIKYSMVIPRYNVEQTRPELIRRVSEVIDLLDGSAQDQTHAPTEQVPPGPAK